MRALLSIIFAFFAVLILTEDLIRAICSFLQRQIKRVLKKKKRKKPHSLAFSFRTKIKYFVLGIFFSLLFLFFPMVIFIFIQDLPSPNELSLRQIPQTTKVYDRNGVLLTEIYSSQNRTLIQLSDVPTHLQQATLAIEDKNFYKHPGFDIPSIIRAFRETILRKHIQGGSTITQQLIKSSMLTPEQSLSRKMKELVLAFWAERIYSKDQILEMYFNQVPYGGTAWGAEAATETYFNKSVKELDLAESAFLAGLTSAPTIYSPYGQYPNAWKNRQKEVLKRMVSLGFISQKQANEAAKEKLVFRSPQRPIHAPHFVNYLKEYLITQYGLAAVEKGGLQIRTTLDLKTQEMAEKVVKDEVEKEAYLNLTNGAAVITDPRNGDLLAMVGSHDFDDPNGGNVNITTSLRQPGSSIKIVTYSAALAHGFTAATLIDDTPVSYSIPGGEAYVPVNYDGKFHGKVSLRTALANSLNIPAVTLLDKVGVSTMVTLAKNMGITHWNEPSDYGLSLTLGAAEVTMLDMARVNGVLANQGKFVEINPILEVSDGKGKMLDKKHPIENKQVLDGGISFILSNILSDNQARTMEFGTNSPLTVQGHTVSVKTGTTDSKRDNWTNGYTNNYVTIVWVGNNDNSPMSQTLASGITGAAPIWNRIMTNLLNKHPESKSTPPVNVVKKTCLGKDEYFLKGTETSVNCGLRPSPSAAYSRSEYNFSQN